MAGTSGPFNGRAPGKPPDLLAWGATRPIRVQPGTYDFSDPEGASELDPNLPAEATDPAACGPLH